MSARRRSGRRYRERCATEARKEIQEARFWLDYDKRDEQPGLDPDEIAVRHAVAAVELARKFHAAVIEEVG